MCLHSMKARHLRTSSNGTKHLQPVKQTTLTSNWKSSSLNLLTLKLVKKATTTSLILYSAVHKAAVLPTTPARSNCGVLLSNLCLAKLNSHCFLVRN